MSRLSKGPSGIHVFFDSIHEWKVYGSPDVPSKYTNDIYLVFLIIKQVLHIISLKFVSITMLFNV